jgi:hypothetical protein
MPLIGGDSPLMMDELRAEFDQLMGKLGPAGVVDEEGEAEDPSA